MFVVSFFRKNSKISLELIACLFNMVIIALSGLKYRRKGILYMLHSFPQILMSPSPSSLLGDGLFIDKTLIHLKPYLKQERKEKWIRKYPVLHHVF